MRKVKQIRIFESLMTNIHDEHIPILTSVSPNLISEELLRKIFLNKSTLQLTFFGLLILQKTFKSYSIQLPLGYELRSQDLITLDRECLMPYYISKQDKNPHRLQNKKRRFIVLFERELAILLKLNDSNLDMVRNIDRNGIF